MPGNVQSNGSSSLEIAQSNQDLIITKGRRKKQRWITAGVVSAIVIALIIVAIVLLTQKKSDEKSAEPVVRLPTLNLEDLLKGKLNPTPFNATWVSDKELLYTDANGDLILYTIGLDRNTRQVLLPSHELIFGSNNFELSADRNFLKVAYAFEKIYRYSYRAKYIIINLKNTTDRFNLTVRNEKGLLLAIWAPVGNAIAVVFENNIYYKPSVASSEIIQITSDGTFISNGVPDWVYEEEVFSSNKALWFSPDGTKLAYARFDDNKVPLMVLPIYGEPGSPSFQYPRANVIKYPKAGAPNPTVTLQYVNLNSGNESNQLEAPNSLSNQEPILSAVTWGSNSSVTAIWMNRVQNKASIISYLINENTHTMQTNLELSESPGWLELFTAPIFSKNESQMILILPSDQGDGKGSYRHVVMIPQTSNAQPVPLTKGNFVVTEILGWNHNKNSIFYLANTEENPGAQHLYSTSVDTQNVKCLSCDVKSHNKNLECLYNSADFSKDFSYYVLTCAGPDVPETILYSLEQKIENWDYNAELQEYINNKQMPKIEKHTFTIDGGFKAQINLKLPPNLDTNKKYPMLINVYAGPDSFQVVEKFNIDWGSYLAANKSIIYATIDGRGSGLKGNEMLFSIYRSLGTVEIADQITVAKKIQELLPYIDANRTAIWGWSYGGYAAGMILASDKENVFKCGMSVAPVTDWTLYDSIYTERFMGLPTKKDNYLGYRNASLLLHYEGIRDKQYFLIHGTYDDNVHYQQSMLWAKQLERNDILFRQLSYPDEDHGLGSVRPHLYHSLEKFLDECFLM